MDRLSDLPPKPDTLQSPEEAAMMNQLFGEAVKSSGGVGSKFSQVDWKLVGVTAVLFLVLANPYIDAILERIPGCCERPLVLLGVKVLIFALAMVIASMVL